MSLLQVLPLFIAYAVVWARMKHRCIHEKSIIEQNSKLREGQSLVTSSTRSRVRAGVCVGAF